MVKNHKIFKGRVWTGTYHDLKNILKVIGHVSACQLRRYQRFTGYGP